MRKFCYTLMLCLLLTGLQAQVAVNTTQANPDASAILDVSSTTKGMLVPRMTSTQRTNIASPATGLLVFDTDESSFWFYNGTGWSGLAGGLSAMEEISSGTSGDAVLTIKADTDNDTETDNPRIEFDQDGSLVKAFIGLEGPDGTQTSGSLANAMLIGGTTSQPAVQLITTNTVRMTVEADGDVGIGTNSPGYKLEVNGSAAKTGGGSWTSTSDRRLKKNIEDYNDGLNQLLKIRPVTYQFNEKSGLDTEEMQVGVIAQELNEVTPYMVGDFEKDGTTYLNVDNSAMTYMLINAVKEQQAQIEKLQQQLNEMETLQASMAQLQNQMKALQAQKEATAASANNSVKSAMSINGTDTEK
ncbi:MAG: tail fiber domain-containing protein [Bacteroidota bacterium]